MTDGIGLIGKVFLVGAGPGDPDLITIKGAKILSGCDVVIYDALVNIELLKFAPCSARIIFTGKPRSGEKINQSAINDLMISEAMKGNAVVRLKCGDPYVFGRGGEEAAALTEAGIDWEIVPGITAGTAVPAYAGIPLTCRGIASSAAFITGHECTGKIKSVDLKKTARAADTIVIFMGGRNISTIAEELISSGLSKHTPVAVIEKGTYPDQSVIVSDLEDIASTGKDFGSPVLIVVGEVVNLRKKFLHNKTLFNVIEN